MPVRYTPDELLRLKASPLVRKPENLPPPEEWIGSPPPQVGARSSLARGKPDEIVPLQEPSSRRPTLLDTKHISRSSIPDDIVLGPPKMSFASATAFRASSKTAGPAETSSFAMLDHDPSRPSRLTARDKLSREKDRPDRETDRAWETRTVGLNGKRAPREREREDADGWTSVKARKSFGHEDGERYTRKPLDRDRDRGVESGREPRERGVRAYDPLTRERQPEADREAAPRRNGVPRGRNEASWFKEKESAPPKERPTRESTGREWREADRTTDHAWGRTTKLEKDPEWMDAPGADESKQVHTAEDFQRWKERMRAGGTPSEEKSKPEEDVTVERGASRHASTSSKPDVKPVAPLVMDSGIDKFFGLWNEPKSTHTESSVEAPEPVSRKDAAKANVGRASRFTSFFSPAEETPAPHMEAPPELTSPPAPHKDASNEDREGFQRILQMLGGTSLDTAKATPYPDQGRHPRQMSNENVHPQAPPNHLPAGMRHRGDSHVAPHQSEAVDLRARSSANMESMHGMAPPESGAARNRDNEFFLGLMHHQRPNPAEDMPAPSARGNPQNWMREPSGEGPDGKGMAGLPPGFMEGPPPGLPHQRRPAPSQGPIPNPGFQRPPGFEHAQVPPGWANPQGLPSQPPRHVPPPPGLTNNGAHHPDGANRGPLPFPPFPGPPGLPPGMPFPMGAPFRGGPNMPPPPNMGPGPGPGPGPPGAGPPLPPTFFNMNVPPPPGYPPMPPLPPLNAPSGPGPGSYPQDPSIMNMVAPDPSRGGGPPRPFDPFAELAGAGAGRVRSAAPPGL